MKRKLIVMMLTLFFMAYVSIETHAQDDGYFTAVNEYRSSDAMGLSFDGFSGQMGNGFNFDSFISGNDGLSFEEFTGDEAPVSSGLFLMTATGLIYLINKRRKENER